MAQTHHFSSFHRFSSSSTITQFPLSREFSIPFFNVSTAAFKTLSFPRNSVGFRFPGESIAFLGKIQFLNALSGERALPELDDSPLSVELLPIFSETQFDRIIAEAQQLEESVIIVWMASWCRKCIYLKPKLEKLAADYYPRLRFYCVDVNNVPHKLVAHAGVTLWTDKKKQSEVIRGHKAHFVINEVRQMIENDSTL